MWSRQILQERRRNQRHLVLGKNDCYRLNMNQEVFTKRRFMCLFFVITSALKNLKNNYNFYISAEVFDELRWRANESTIKEAASAIAEYS